MTIFKPVAATFAFLLLAGCESLSISGQTIAYNEAVANSTNEFFLLNVLRARDRFPLYYTRTTGNVAAMSATPGVAFGLDASRRFNPSMTVSGSAGEQLSLANLDDQKFMRGVLAPVPLSALDAYLGQGWPTELVYMMFLKKIEIDKNLARVIADAMHKKCAEHPHAPYCDETLPSVPTKVAAEEPGHPRPLLARQVLACPTSSGGKTYVFDNYPPAGPDAMDCFQAALRMLIALGLAPASSAKFTVIAANVRQSEIGALNGLGSAATAKLAISELPTGNYAACTKAELNGFTLDSDFVSDEPNQDLCAALRSKGLHSSPEQRSKDLPSSAEQSDLYGSAVATGAETTASLVSTSLNGVSGGAAPILGPSLPESCAAQVERDACKPIVGPYCKLHKNDDARCGKPTFRFTTRSLDSMIYYLGEVMRARIDIADKYAVEILVQHEGYPFEKQTMFVVEQDAWFTDGVVQTTYRGSRYAIPGPCGDEDHCAHAANRSVQVLSLLNQIWGLQKEAVEAPSVPVVSVINSQ